MKSSTKPVTPEHDGLTFSGKLKIKAVDRDTGEVIEREVKNAITRVGKIQLLKLMVRNNGNAQFISHLGVGYGGDSYVPGEGTVAMANETTRIQVASTDVDDVTLLAKVSAVFDGATLVDDYNSDIGGSETAVPINEFGSFFYDGTIDVMWSSVVFETILITNSIDITFQYIFGIE